MTFDDFCDKLINMTENFINNVVKICGISHIYIDDDFSFSLWDHSIGITFLYFVPVETECKKFYISIGLPDNLYDCFGVSLLHELGHYKTQNNFTSGEWEKDFKKRKEIDAIENFETRNKEYFNLPTEKAASEWAVAFIKRHEEDYIKFCCAIHDFCIEHTSDFVTDL